MQRFVAFLATLAFITPACAADMAMKAAPVVPPPAYNWTGYYVGGNIGGIWSNDPGFALSTPGGGAPFFTPADAGLIATNGSGSLGGKSDFTFGAQAGYNYQFNQTLVGAEADVERWGLKGSASGGGLTGGGPQVTTTSLNADVLVTLRARLGYVFDRTLLYATGGGAYSNIKYSQATGFIAGVPTADNATDNSNQWGWTVGGGAEYAIDQHWIVRAEYLYVAFPSRTFTTNPTSPFGPVSGTVPFTHTLSSLDASIARVALNYKF